MAKVHGVIFILWFIFIIALAVYTPGPINILVGAFVSITIYVICLMQIPEFIIHDFKRLLSETEICDYCSAKLDSPKVEKNMRKFKICSKCDKKYVSHFGATKAFGLTKEQEDKFWKHMREKNEQSSKKQD